MNQTVKLECSKEAASRAPELDGEGTGPPGCESLQTGPVGAEPHRQAGCAAVRSQRGRLASGCHRAAPRVGAESRFQGPIVGAQVLLSLPRRERAAAARHAPVPELRAVPVVPLRAPLLSGARLNDTTIFLPNFPAELTGACEGQGACPGSLSKTAKPLASGQGRGTLVPAPGRLTRGSFINNGNNRASLSLSRADSRGSQRAPEAQAVGPLGRLRRLRQRDL